MHFQKIAQQRLFDLLRRTGQLESLAAPFQTRIVIWGLSFAVFLNGLIAWALSFSHWLPNGVEDFLPFDVDRFTRFSGVLAGLILIYFSRQLLRGRRLAFYVATGVSLSIGILHTFYFHPHSAAIIPLATAALLIANRRHFKVKSRSDNLAQGAQMAVISFGIAILYGVIGFQVLHLRDFGTAFGPIEAIERTIRELIFIGNDDLIPHTQYARWFLDSLDLAGTLSAVLVVYSLFRPLQYKFSTLPAVRQEAKDLLEFYGGTSEDFFKLWPEDKSYFFDEQRQNFIAYKTVDGISLSLGGPAGKDPTSTQIINDFQAYCHENGLSGAFVHVGDNLKATLKKKGYSFVKIGEEAIIDLHAFAAHTARNKHFRYVDRKFVREGYSAELLKAPIQPNTLSELKHVSDSWLKLPHHQDRGFALGYFSPNHLSRQSVMVVRSPKGKIIAFTNVIPSYDKDEANIDLFRHSQTAPTNTNDYLLMQLMLVMHKQGFPRLNLGLSPLAGMKNVNNPSPTSRILALIYTNGGRFYSFRGLRRFKQKFEPNWENRYIAYHTATGSLVRTAVAFYRAMRL